MAGFNSKQRNSAVCLLSSFSEGLLFLANVIAKDRARI